MESTARPLTPAPQLPLPSPHPRMESTARPLTPAPQLPLPPQVTMAIEADVLFFTKFGDVDAALR